MRIDRLEVATSTDKMEMRLHPRITLITGLAQLEREALTAELTSSMGAGRPGLSNDLLDDSGRILLVQRPLKGPAVITDALNGDDITSEFTLANGTVSIAGSLGVKRNELRSFVRIGAQNMKAEARKDELILRMAQIDQNRLWSAALTLAEVEVEVANQNDEVAQTDQHEDFVDAIEDCHLRVQQANERLENMRSALTASSATLAVLAFVAALVVHPLAALPFLLASVGCASLGFYNYQQLEQATAAESSVLEAAGLESYLTLQLVQLEKLTASPAAKLGIRLDEIHRLATECWQELVGMVPLEWAVGHRLEIEAAAKGRYRSAAPITDPAEMVDRIHAHLGRVGNELGESLPAVLDDPFTILDDFDVAAVLSMITDHAHAGQVIVMTDDARVTGWGHQLASRYAATVLDLSDHTSGNAPAALKITKNTSPEPASASKIAAPAWG